MSPRTEPEPGAPGAAYCPHCNSQDVKTRLEYGVEVYEPHSRNGSEVKCMTGSNRPVRR